MACEIILLEGGPESSALIKVAGLSVLQRLVLGACSAGFQQFYIIGTDLEPLIEGLKKDKRTRSISITTGPAEVTTPRVVVEANVVLSQKIWEALARATENISLDNAPKLDVVGYPARASQAPLMDGASYVLPVRSVEEGARAKKVIFANVTKKSSGPVSKHFNSLLSLPLSKFLCEFGVTPNQVTLATTLVGLLSAWIVSLGTFGTLAVAGILFQLCAALDRVDGELARSTFTASAWGAWIDTVGDNLVYLAFIVGITVGYHEYASTQGLAVVNYIYPIGGTTLLLAAFLIISMGIYLKRHGQAGTMTAVQSDMARRVDRDQAGVVYRFLDAIQLLGKRDSFSLITCIICLMPWLTGSSVGFHLLFWCALLIVLLVITYYTLGLLNIKNIKVS